jgi:hypothetical protein
MADLYGASITYAHINEKGQLILLLSNDTVITAGHVVGPVGATGPQGVPGPRGAAGKDGTEIFVRSGPPDPAVGKTGDLWISSATWQLWVKASSWGSPMDLMPGANNLDAQIRRFNGGGGGGSPRFFGMGAPSYGGGGGGTVMVGGGSGDGNLSPILGNNAPLAAGTPLVVASDPVGDAMIVDLWAQGPQGTLFVEVGVSRGVGTDTGYSVVYEIQMGTQPPVLTFTPIVTGAGGLQLQVSSDVALTTLRGRVLLL